MDARSKFLESDGLIDKLVDHIDATKCYFALGRDLLGSHTIVSNIIGKTHVDYDEVVYECLYRWKNEHGASAGDKLIQIFKDVKLGELAEKVEQELKKEPMLLNDDTYIQRIVDRMDCVAVHHRLGLALLDYNSGRLSNLIGPLTCPPDQYRDALLSVLITWRNQSGTSIKSLEKLKQVLIGRGQRDAAHVLHQMEYGP